MPATSSHLRPAVGDGPTNQAISPIGKLLVLISSRHDDRFLVRHGALLAAQRQLPMLVLWIDTGQIRQPQAMQRLEQSFALARELGGQTLVLQGPSRKGTLVAYLQAHQPPLVLLGAPAPRRWRWPWRLPLANQLLQANLADEVAIQRRPEEQERADWWPSWFGSGRGYLVGLLAMVAAGTVGFVVHQFLGQGSLVVLYLLSVTLVGLSYGARPAVFTALLSFFAFNYLHVEPYFTLDVHHTSDSWTLAFLISAGLICGPVASRARHQFELLKAANRAAEWQRDYATELTRVNDAPSLWQCWQRQVQRQCQCPVWLWAEHRWQDGPPPLAADEHAMFLQAMQAGQPQGHGFGSPSGWLCWPLAVAGCDAGLLMDFRSNQRALWPAQREYLLQIGKQTQAVAERLALAEQLENNRRKAEMEQLRSALLASVSHDLRSPLAAMMGSAESLLVLREQLSASDQVELLHTILSESQRLDRYIQNLLDMTRLGHGGLKLERDWVAVGDIIGSVVQRLRRSFPELPVQIPECTDLPLLYVHAALIEQALFNIIENAARYSPADGQVALSVQLQADSLLLAIEDQGPGIPPDQREAIFDMFYVVADGDHKRHNTGMGLAICRGMINAHGGKVWVESARQGSGARFIVQLPLQQGGSDEC